MHRNLVEIFFAKTHRVKTKFIFLHEYEETNITYCIDSMARDGESYRGGVFLL